MAATSPKGSVKGQTAHIACLQVRPMPDFDSAIEEALTLAQQVSKNTQMLLLPEYCSGFKVIDGRFAPPSASPESNPMLKALQEHARTAGVWILAGSMAVPSSAGDKINNRGFIIDDSGKLVSDYNKIHLFDIQLSATEVYRESDIVAPGSQLSITETPVGTIGHTICYDLRFASLYRDLAQSGAEILAIPAAFTRKTGKAHWHALCRARAIENGAWVIAPCAVGDIAGGGGSFGHSLVISPWGEIVADGGDEPGVVEAIIDLGEVSKARQSIPSLQHDRPWKTEDERGENVA